MKYILTLLTLISVTLTAQAALEVQKVANNVYALVGETTQRSVTNFGNNSTHGVIITNEGVVLIDSGASYLGAQEIHQTIQTLTDKPIKIVINTGGQDHRWLGNEYFQKLGARIVASTKAQADQKARADYHLTRLGGLIKQSLEGTNPVVATEVFETQKNIKLGDVKLELYYFGSAHTAGDIFIYMPSEQIMFTGDIVFNDRMLGIGPARNSQSWVNVFDKMANLSYLKFLIHEVAKILDFDGDMLQASKIDQSDFHFLSGHESIAGKNAQWVFEQMEFDY